MVRTARPAPPCPPLFLQRPAHHAQGHALAVPLAGEHARKTAQPFVPVQAPGGPELAGDELPGGLLLLLGVELPDGFVDHRRVHALGPQLTDQRAAGEPAAVVPGLDPGIGERGVVDQPDVLEAGQHLLGRLVRDLPLAQGVRELLAGARCAGEQAQADIACPLDRVARFPLLGPRRGGGTAVTGPGAGTASRSLTGSGGRAGAAALSGHSVRRVTDQLLAAAALAGLVLPAEAVAGFAAVSA